MQAKIDYFSTPVWLTIFNNKLPNYLTQGDFTSPSDWFVGQRADNKRQIKRILRKEHRNVF